MTTPAEVLHFWFSDRARPLWFSRDDAFDGEIRAQFASTVEQAGRGELDGWASTGDGAMALVIVLDQFPRNLFRGSAKAFSFDAHARVIANRAIEAGFDKGFPLDRRFFLYMPLQHSESLADQERSVALFTQWAQEHDASQREVADDHLRYALSHRDTIVRFGRFPHRNAALGRVSTPDEESYIAQPS
jgi:uncharacterized protein (DUF924 family)